MFLAAAMLALAVAGCETGYRNARSSVVGGYNSDRKDYNVFHVWYTGNGFVTKDKAIAMAHLRAAELSLEHGFPFLAVLATETTTDSFGKPLAQVAIGCFRDEPKGVQAYAVHDAAVLFRDIVDKYELKRDGQPMEPERGDFQPAPEAIAFELAPWYEAAAIDPEEVDYVFLGFDQACVDGFMVGWYVDFENPTATLEDFVKAARPIAAQLGANALVVESNAARIQSDPRFAEPEQDLLGFVAELYVAPEAALGIEWEPGEMALDKYVVRRFRTGSRCAEAGMRLGDKVLAINGLDVLYVAGQLEQWKSWSVGEKVRVTVVRDGQEKIVEVPLVPNMIVAQ